MIAVIADDFSGAAELGGIGLRAHLSVEVSTTVQPNTKADLLILATDARSLPEKEAVQVMQQFMQQLMALQPKLIFKKTDSVLRGHIVKELLAQLPIAQCNKAVLVPANPMLGRTIQDGRYYIHGEPVHETSFSHDPDFAITSPVIKDMLHSNGYDIYVKKWNESLPAKGIIVGEASATNDLEAWAELIDQQTLAAGAAGFFEAILQTKIPAHAKAGTGTTPFNKKAPSLFVCGSTFAHSQQAVQRIQAAGGPVCYMPDDIIQANTSGRYAYVKWGNEVVALIKKYGHAIIAIHPGSTRELGLRPVQLREKMAELVNEVLQRSMVQELFIEGGATAWSVVSACNLSQFFPVQEMATGVVRMQTCEPGLCITVKPGSYTWPDGIWDY